MTKLSVVPLNPPNHCEHQERNPEESSAILLLSHHDLVFDVCARELQGYDSGCPPNDAAFDVLMLLRQIVVSDAKPDSAKANTCTLCQNCSSHYFPDPCRGLREEAVSRYKVLLINVA